MQTVEWAFRKKNCSNSLVLTSFKWCRGKVMLLQVSVHMGEGCGIEGYRGGVWYRVGVSAWGVSALGVSARHPPPQVSRRHRHCRSRYASYWNASLFKHACELCCRQNINACGVYHLLNFRSLKLTASWILATFCETSIRSAIREGKSFLYWDCELIAPQAAVPTRGIRKQVTASIKRSLNVANSLINFRRVILFSTLW